MTSQITPEEARKIIDATEGTTDYTWSDLHHALETIAGMKEEWGVTGQWNPHIEWFSDKDSAERFMKKVSPTDPRLARRYVTVHEVITDE